MALWKLKLLGGFCLSTADGQRVVLPGRKHQALIAFVALSSGQVVTRDRVLGLLWGSRSEDQARASLRGVLSEIRRACRQFSASPINTDRTRISIPDASMEVDAETLNKALRETSLEALDIAVHLYDGELMDSININERMFEEWKQIEQQNAKMIYRKVLVRYLHALQQQGSTTEMEEAANRLLDLDDADEDAHRTLMKLYHAQGRTSLALRQFELCRERLRSRYNSDVSDETLSLLSTIKAPAKERQPDVSTESRDSAAPRSSSGLPEVAFAVLPFEVSSDQLNGEFGRLISEEIIGAASKFKWFRVVPSSESFKQDMRDLGSAEVARRTGAKYVLHGRIRRVGEGHILSIELVDGINSRTFWSERFELTHEALCYPEDLVARVAGQLDVRIRASEIAQAHNLDRKRLTPYQCTLLALSNMYDLSSASYEDSERLFAEAIKRSPNNSWFYSVWSLWKMFCLGQAWTKDYSETFQRAGELARQAIKRDPDDALALVIAGHYESFWALNLNQGKTLIDNSLTLNPYSSFAWMLSSATYSYRGEPLQALERLERSKWLCPVESHFEFLFNTANCVAHLFNHNPEQAVQWGYKTVRENPGFTNGYKHLLVALGHLKRVEECEHYSRQLLRIEPSFRAETFLQAFPFAKEEDRAFYREGLIHAMAPRQKGAL